VVLIRRERSGDERSVHRIHDQAFGSGSGRPAPEATLVDLLREDRSSWLPRLSLVAEEDELPVGHVLCTRGLLRGEIPALALGPIGVLPRHQGLGIGTALVHAVCAAADALDETVVILLGDPTFYQRTGFVLAERFRITPPAPDWAPHFQARPLTRVQHGEFRYPQAFAAVSA
jgi:putative acetyltransferase